MDENNKKTETASENQEKTDAKKNDSTIGKIKDSAVKIAGNLGNAVKDPDVINAGKTIGNKLMDAFKNK